VIPGNCELPRQAVLKVDLIHLSMLAVSTMPSLAGEIFIRMFVAAFDQAEKSWSY